MNLSSFSSKTNFIKKIFFSGNTSALDKDILFFIISIFSDNCFQSLSLLSKIILLLMEK